ncbi:TPA_asm: hypothetical protein GB439_04335 [Salmonella enterica subsp. enterica]|uniref:Uncharacterized protein n=2 Tax=Salmonella enterica TaxID=28901 RepID=A0A5U7QUN7_SALER|nr:hypothetical protein [Salmonella enterica]ECD4938712.1 hypothetical protein [Salmonella enterica subsp. enterica]EHK0685266.1 hypothetical protein [Salmonella enterica subsp. enterica serovar Kingston]EBR5544852.1 hypothetical protein [Salmonella enterica]ECI4813947.1 hypothetical protein [Salmonella enterica subsp. enterica]
MPRFEAVLIKIENLDGSIIEQYWGIYDYKTKTLRPERYNSLSEADEEAKKLNIIDEKDELTKDTDYMTSNVSHPKNK